MRRLALSCALLLAGCFGGVTPEGKYYCANQNGCLTGHICYQNYCCKQDQATGLCLDHPCIVNGTDSDRDGFPLCAGDCDDEDPSANPGAVEICDHKDNNCNTEVDEGSSVTFFRDSDGDGHGDPAAPVVVCPADPSTGLAAAGGDCDDANPERYPGNPEVCDGADNNCNAEVDEGVMLTWFRDDDLDGYGRTDSPLQRCARPDGYAALKDDCNDSSAFVHPNAVELCNGVDEDCNGIIDEGVKVSVWRDLDDDGFGAKVPAATLKCGADLHEALNDLDCNDANGAVNPGATEVCNTVDDNCSGTIDEGVTQTFWPDRDGDTFGSNPGSEEACSPRTGFVANRRDCDDTRAAVNPFAAEVCNGLDDNCNGLTDEALKVTYFRDVDTDGYGNGAQPSVACPPAAAGYVENPLDCGDTDATVYPGAPERCDAKDNDCDGVKDENPNCGPRLDTADLAALWGGGTSPLNSAPSGCLAGAAGVVAVTPVRDAAVFAAVSGNTGSISVADSSGRDFFAYYPGARNGDWRLTGQRLTFQIQGNAPSWDAAFRQPLVLFCSSNGTFARFEPAATAVGASFAVYTVTVPAATAIGWSFAGGFTFAGSQVNWVEVHVNNGGSGSAKLWLDDFRFVPQ